MEEIIATHSSFIFDLDGTVYSGSGIIPNVPETINTLQK
jgi:ribonucleotide monophosphatase NagD (HAD superfamily)